MVSRLLSTEALARASAEHPWRVVAAWIVLLISSFVLVSTLLADALTTNQEMTNDPDYARARAILSERFPGPDGLNELVIVRSASATIDDAEFRGFVERLTSEIAALGPGVVAATANYYLLADEDLVSADRDTTIVPVIMAGSRNDAIANAHKLHEIVDAAGESGEFEVFQTGRATAGSDFQEASERDLLTGELIALPIALVILVLVFGALAAAVVPMLLAGVAIVVATGASALLGQTFELSFFVVNMITMMGLATGIDYSLFIVSRYREERRRGRDQQSAIVATGGTASRAVLFSGMTVVVALAGLLLVPVNVFRSLSIGAIFVVIAATLASLTLLPAVLSLVGDRINALRIPIFGRASAGGRQELEGGFWDRITRAVMARPIVSLVIAAGILIAAATPALDIETGAAGVSTLPEGMRSRDGLVVLQDEFSAGLLSPVQIVVDGDATSARVQDGVGRLSAALASDADFGALRLAPAPAGDALLITVPVAGDPTSRPAAEAVKRLKTDIIPQAFDGVDARVFVGGATAENVEFFDISDRYTPIVIVFVLAISFILLMVVFRSLIVPIKAIFMNLLSVGAAYGVIVLVSQKGVGADLLGFQQLDVVEAWIPMFLFAVLFGLSMDYHVFMLSRIRERFDQRGDNTEAVSFGLRTTAGLITGAAAIMVAVFGGFATGDLIMFQQIGLGLAVAVFLDATVVRSVLVPASMKLLGDRNWYLPRWLRWLPDLRVEAPEDDFVEVEAETAAERQPAS